MDYVVGSVAALITGNVTPNRPKVTKKALKPVKNQQSPNVTPKTSEFGDRSIFLSPTLQKKKAIVKKSPKRIFENPDLDITKESDSDNISVGSKGEKVKKQLKADLESETTMAKNKSAKRKQGNLAETVNADQTKNINTGPPSPNKKKRKQNNDIVKQSNAETDSIGNANKDDNVETKLVVNPKKKNKETKNVVEEKPTETTAIAKVSPKKNKKRKGKKQNKNVVNPNAITEKDTDSEHESDNEIDSENEKEINEALTTQPGEESSDEEEEEEKKNNDKNKQKKEKKESVPLTEEEIKRTLFVGNVPFSKKCKKIIKKIFVKHGRIDSVRIRGVPVKDAHSTPKLAVIKNELHPERTTVNVYIKFSDSSSVEKALVENNLLLNECHLRVSRSNETGSMHDPHKSIFIGNMPFAMEDEALRTIFGNCGAIHSVRIIRDKKTNVGKGFGYVNFESKDGVELALQLSPEDLTVKNRIMRVKRCTETQKNRGHGKPQGKFQEKFQGKVQATDERPPGAYRRIANKRGNQQGDSNDGPEQKKFKDAEQPGVEKKARKEFVGMTAEKKKKNKFNKGQKKKKQLSEILTK